MPRSMLPLVRSVLLFFSRRRAAKFFPPFYVLFTHSLATIHLECGENFFHALPSFVADNFSPESVAILGRIGNRVAHAAKSAFIKLRINDQLQSHAGTRNKRSRAHSHLDQSLRILSDQRSPP